MCSRPCYEISAWQRDPSSPAFSCNVADLWASEEGVLVMILATLTLRRVWIDDFKTPFPITKLLLMLFFPGTLVHYNLSSLSAGRMQWT